ncbi:MAG: toll/interleukin-1 receptor domain-containing protein [Planctomycetota bacterium]
MPDPKTQQVFISYSHADHVRVNELAQKLEAEGLKVWMDRKIPPGQDLQREIEKALDESEILLIVMSTANKSASPYQYMELGMALHSAAGRSRKTVIPVLLDGTDRAALPPFLRNHLTIEFNPGEEEKAAESIAKVAGLGINAVGQSGR